jgi:hypothetical protein
MGESSSSGSRTRSQAPQETVAILRFGDGDEDRDWVGWDAESVSLGLRFGEHRIPDGFEFPPLKRLWLEGRRDELGDLPRHQHGQVLCASERALDAILPFLTGEDQVFPLPSPFGKYYAINVLRYIDSLDVGRSKAHWAVPKKRAFAVHEFVFRPQTIPTRAIFRVPQAPGYILLTDPVDAALHDAGAEGYVLLHLGDVVPATSQSP